MKNIITKEIAKHPKRSVVTGILLFTLIIAFIGALIQYNLVLMLMIVTISILICLPMIIGKFSKIDIPPQIAIFTTIFIYCSLFLGELRNYYATYWWWDVLLHLGSGLAFGILGFITLYILYKTEKFKISPKIVAVLSFAFALSIGALWEIIEFTIDSIFGPISNHKFM